MHWIVVPGDDGMWVLECSSLVQTLSWGRKGRVSTKEERFSKPHAHTKRDLFTRILDLHIGVSRITSERVSVWYMYVWACGLLKRSFLVRTPPPRPRKTVLT